MLEELSISNIALIDKMTIKFSEGFNCLSGETGAGKSILAGALGLLRGEKGDNDLIRTGCDEAGVSAVFFVGNNGDAKAWMAEHGLEAEDERVVIRRVLRRNNKSGIYLQGQSFILKDLSDFTSLIFDMHGQHEHQSLFAVDKHREMLDRFGRLGEEASALYGLFSELASLMKEREKLQEKQRDRGNQQDYLAYALKEIEEANVSADEDVALEKERNLLHNSEKLFSLCSQAYDSLSAGSEGALSYLFSAKHGLHEASLLDPDLADYSQRLENLYYELEDLSQGLQSYQDKAVYDPNRLEEIEDRLSLLGKLKKKYGPELADLRKFQESARAELDQLENFDERLGELNRSVKELEAKVLNQAAALSKKRKAAALTLKNKVEEGLKSLSMAKTSFEIQFRQKESDRGTPICGPHGIDDIEFLLSANPGEPLKPLKAVASGGEISRIMLAIKAAMADTEKLECLIFDEIDTGIGGEVAVALGEHLYQLSRSTQILAITHLASIAVRADNHLRVEKTVEDGRTLTRVTEIKGNARVEEIARMLSGDPRGDASISHATELLRRYQRV